MSAYPISYWFVIGLIIAGGIWSFQRIKDGTGIPMLAVIGTVAVWYVGDAYYNGYANNYVLLFEPDALQNAWLQVALFLIVFLAAVPAVHQWFNARYLHQQSGVYQLAKFGVNQPVLQRQLDVLFNGCLIIYGALILIAVIRLKGEILYFFFPFLGYKAEPWGRGRLGSGFDALLSFAFYIQMLMSAVFGVLAAVATNPRTRILSLILCFVSWPYFLFDRTRNVILSVVIPAILSWVFLRLRGGIWKKIVALGGCFILLNGWMAFIIQNRSDISIATAFRNQGFNLKKESEVHHEGLNMFEELCWINTFIEEGTYEPNWGARYFAELVNPIPRVIWHGKPLIGIDYAIARGQGERGSGGGAGTSQGNVYATISTGLIGQGVVNFGRILGPAAAALLMSFWVAILARRDLNILKLGYLPLYSLGLILTFNLGRDITFITLYPFVFLAAALWWLNRNKPDVLPGSMQSGAGTTSMPSRQSKQPYRQGPYRPAPYPQVKQPRMPVRRKQVATRFRSLRGPGQSSAGSKGSPPPA
jgi:hypothetical protein